MSLENIYNKKCVLCYINFHDLNAVHECPQITISVISSCLKHIPQDINQTVNWNHLSENNCLVFCKTCDYNIRTLSQLNSDLEEIQRKINELVNCITFHARKERGINTENFASQSQSKSASLLSNFPVNIVQPQKEQYEVGILPIPNKTESNILKDVEGIDDDNDFESINSDDNGGASSDNGRTTETIGNKSSSVVTKASTVWTSNSTIQCNEQTKPKSNLQKLLESTSGYECSTCHKRFSRYNILQKHDCGKQTVECDTCGLSFSSSGVLTIHTRTHTGEKPYKCETCGLAFSIKANLRTHIQSKHTKEKTFECKICKMRFSYAVALSKHNLSHKNQVLFNCDVCSESFKSLSRLKFHLVSHSTETSHPYKCDFCDKTFATPKFVNQHKKRAHFSERQHQCDMCGKSFKDSRCLQRHKMIHSGEKPFQCSHCGKHYRTSEELRSHEWTHKDEGPIECKICGKFFKNPHSLKIHVRYHKTNRIPCEMCGKSFTRNNLTKHLGSVHRKEKPFKCDICDKRFFSKRDRKTHVERFCHICNIFVPRGESDLALLKHQTDVHTVLTILYSNEIPDSIGKQGQRKILLRKECKRKCARKVKYGEFSSESEEINSENFDDEDATKDVKFKVEFKVENEFSEVEDSDSYSYNAEYNI